MRRERVGELWIARRKAKTFPRKRAIAPTENEIPLPYPSSASVFQTFPRHGIRAAGSRVANTELRLACTFIYSASFGRSLYGYSQSAIIPVFSRQVHKRRRPSPRVGCCIRPTFGQSSSATLALMSYATGGISLLGALVFPAFESDERQID